MSWFFDVIHRTVVVVDVVIMPRENICTIKEKKKCLIIWFNEWRSVYLAFSTHYYSIPGGNIYQTCAISEARTRGIIYLLTLKESHQLETLPFAIKQQRGKCFHFENRSSCVEWKSKNHSKWWTFFLSLPTFVKISRQRVLWIAVTLLCIKVAFWFE